MKKHLLPLYLLIILSGFLEACTQSAKQTADNQPDSMAITNPEPVTSVSADGLLMTILKTETGMARGVSLGDNIDKVKNLEKTEMTQDSTIFQGYTEYFDDSDEEFVDVLYYFDKNRKITGINLDIYLNKQPESDALLNDFKEYFVKKYGNSKQLGKQWTWQLPQTRLVLEDKSVKNLPGFSIQFAKSTVQ